MRSVLRSAAQKLGQGVPVFISREKPKDGQGDGRGIARGRRGKPGKRRAAYEFQRRSNALDAQPPKHEMAERRRLTIRKPIAVERFGTLIHLFAHQFLLMTTLMSKRECEPSSFVDRMIIPENGRFRKVEIHVEGERHVHPHKAEYADREPAAPSHRAANSARLCCEIAARSNPCRCSCCVLCDERGRSVESGGDEQAVDLLEELGPGLAGKVARRFKPEIHIYPTHDAILEILSDMEDDGSLGPDIDNFN